MRVGVGEIDLGTLRRKRALHSTNPPPAIGDLAAGHGVRGAVVAIPDKQPLAADGIWRVTLEGESFGRLVRHRPDAVCGAAWHLLQLDEMTDAQLDVFDVAMSEEGASS